MAQEMSLPHKSDPKPDATFEKDYFHNGRLANATSFLSQFTDNPEAFMKGAVAVDQFVTLENNYPEIRQDAIVEFMTKLQHQANNSDPRGKRQDAVDILFGDNHKPVHDRVKPGKNTPQKLLEKVTNSIPLTNPEYDEIIDELDPEEQVGATTILALYELQKIKASKKNMMN